MISRLSSFRLLLGSLCIVLALSGVSGGKGKGGKGSRYGRKEKDETWSWNLDPEEENVMSAPIVPFTSEPTESSAPTSSPAPSISEKPSTTPGPTTTLARVSFSPAPSLSTSPTVTARPTLSSIPTTSPVPSPAPSLSLVPTTTARPTLSSSPTTSPVPSPAPSLSAAPTTTARPSLSPFPTSSPFPTVTLCTTNDQGFFGDPSPQSMEVVFGYQLEYEEGNNPVEVVSDLESSFNDFLLPLLFPNDCPSPARRFLSFARRLETIGVSKRPDDVPLDGVTCADDLRVDEANECTVMEGALTVYITNDTPSTSEDEIRSALQQGMEDGAFNESPIVKVSYVDLETDPDPNQNGGGDPVNTQGSGRGRGLVYGIVAGVAALLLFGLALLWRRKKKRDDETNLSSVMENDTLEPNDTTVDRSGT